MGKAKNITNGNIYKNYLFYALPLILSSILSSLYSTVDAVIAGKFISEHALGAISATSSFDILFGALFMGIASGFSIYVAQLFGKGERTELKHSILNMTFFSGAVAVFISLLSIFLRTPILHYLKIDEVLYRDAEIYFIIYTASYVFVFINRILINSLYALGVTSFSIYVSLISAVINIGGNLIAILVLDLGVAGLAYSTVLSVIAATVIYVVMLLRVFQSMEGEKRPFRLSLRCVKNSLIYTIPTALQKMAFHVTGIFISPAINALGANATTGYSVMNRMYNICGLVYWNMCCAVDCHTAQAIGAGEHKKLNKGLWAGLVMNVAILTPVVLVITIFAKPIASIFFPTGYAGPALDYAVRFFQVYSAFLYINMLGHLFHSYMRSIGRVNTVLWITMIGSAVKIGATLLLIPRFHMDGVYIGQSLSWFVDAAICVAIYFLFYFSEEKIKKVTESIARRTGRA